MKDFGQCEETRKDSKIVIKDAGSKNSRSKFRLENPDKTKVKIIKVDDCVIKEGKRCDYLVILLDNQ